jgi:hypothetical protein
VSPKPLLDSSGEMEHPGVSGSIVSIGIIRCHSCCQMLDLAAHHGAGAFALFARHLSQFIAAEKTAIRGAFVGDLAATRLMCESSSIKASKIGSGRV